MTASTHLPVLVSGENVGAAPRAMAPIPTFEAVYREHFAFVWRSARRLGVPPAALDDVVQEVFVVVHRRLACFEGRSSLRTWLFGIALRVARDHRRSVAARPHEPLDGEHLAADAPGPREALEKAEAVALLYALLDELDVERREIFVMAELEQITMPEIAATLGLNLNTAYARLRAARQTFEAALGRHRARESGR